MGLYGYAKPDQMDEHRFTDDAAVVWAISKKSAFKKFSKYYGNAKMKDIFKIPFDGGVHILTDY